MSEIENPADTVVRLLQKKMSIVKDDGSLANILVSKEWYDRELSKNYDGQITVGLAESRNDKIELSGKLRRRLGSLRLNIWAFDRLMRNRIVEEVNQIVRQNCKRPNETLYNFVGVGPATNVHKAYAALSATELAPGHASWTELALADYEKLWYSDNTRCSESSNVEGKYAMMLFRFKIESRENTVKKIVLTFEGYGTAYDGFGVTIKVWNHMAQAWQHAQTGTDDDDEIITISITTSITDYIDNEGYVWLLARTLNPCVYSSPPNGIVPAILYCDYVSCTITVNGITYLDIVSFRDADRVDVKPFIFRTEFTLKSWMFEDVGGAF